MSNGAKYSSFHILGASLGAHVAGYVGHFCQGRLGRITGLDPSGPLFHSVHESEKLSKHDALFVGKRKKMCLIIFLELPNREISGKKFSKILYDQ